MKKFNKGPGGGKFTTPMGGPKPSGHFTTPGEKGTSPFMGAGLSQGTGTYNPHLTTPGNPTGKHLTSPELKFVDRTAALWNSSGFQDGNVNRTDATDDRKQMAGMP